VSLVFFIPWLYYLLRYVIEVGNGPERYKTIASFGFAFFWVFAGIGTILPAVQKVGESAARMAVSNSLKQIGHAFHNYASDHQDALPPAALIGKDGKPGLSWRVAILPYVEQENLYKTFKLDEPWDSPHNRKLLPLMPKVYAPPGGPQKGQEHLTHYRVFVGQGTMYPDKFRINFAREARVVCYPARYNIGNIPDGTSNTILAVEAAEAVPWTKPEELEYDGKQPLPKLGAQNKRGFMIVLYDGSVRFVSGKIDEQKLRWLIEPDDGHWVSPDDY
jgi:hypothetical protein